MNTTATVTFWRQLDGRVVAQKRDKFFTFPQNSPVGEAHEGRVKVAQNFDSAPLLKKGFDVSGATVIEEIEVTA